jgi:hypothetical protein
MRLAHASRLIVLLLPFVSAAGCASDNAGRIEGTSWQSDSAKVKGQNLPAGFMKVDFRANGDLVFRAGPHVITGKYTLGPGNKVILYLDRELAGQKTHAETVVIRGDRMKMTDSDGTELTFRPWGKASASTL